MSYCEHQPTAALYTILVEPINAGLERSHRARRSLHGSTSELFLLPLALTVVFTTQATAPILRRGTPRSRSGYMHRLPSRPLFLSTVIRAENDGTVLRPAVRSIDRAISWLDLPSISSLRIVGGNHTARQLIYVDAERI